MRVCFHSTQSPCLNLALFAFAGEKNNKKLMRRGVGQRVLNATRTFYVPSVSELLAKVVDRWI